MKRLFFILFATIIIGITAVECGKETTIQEVVKPTKPARKIASLIIKGPQRVNIGESITLKAEGYDADGKRVSANPEWSIDDTSLATADKTVGESIILTGIKAGVVYIKAVQGTVSVETAAEIK